MASSYTLNSYTSYQGRKLVLYLSQSKDIANNRSLITWTLSSTGGSSNYYSTGPTTVTIAGSQRYYKGRTDWSAKSFPAAKGSTSGSFYVSHNSNGTCSVAAKLSTAIYTKSVTTNSGTWTLDTIERASTISSAANVTLGNKCSVQWTPHSTVFQYKLKFSLGSWSYTTDYIKPGTTSAYTYSGYTIPIDTLLSQIPNTTGTMTVELTTYNGTTKVGDTSSKTFTVTVPEKDSSGKVIGPSIGTLSYTFTGYIFKGTTYYDYLIKGKNKIKINVSGCKAGTGATIKSYSISGPDLSSTQTTTAASVSATSDILTSTGSKTYTVKITDSRGRTASKTTPAITCYNYYTPSLSGFTAYRSNADGTKNVNGAYLKYSYKADYITNIDNKADIKIYYSNINETIPTEIGPQPNDVIDLKGDRDKTYKIWVKITDLYGGVYTTNIVTVLGASRVINVTKDGTGIAFGKMAEKKEFFECRWPMSVKSLTLQEPLLKIKDVNQYNVSITNAGTTDIPINATTLGNWDPTGWTPIGIVGFSASGASTGASYVSYSDVYCTSSSVHFEYRLHGATTATVQLTAKVLFYKQDSGIF